MKIHQTQKSSPTRKKTESTKQKNYLKTIIEEKISEIKDLSVHIKSSHYTKHKMNARKYCGLSR